MIGRKKNIYLAVSVLFIGLLIMIGTFSYWTWVSGENKNIVFNTAKGLADYIIYDSGESKFVGDFKVGNSYTEGVHTTVSIYKKEEASKAMLYATIYMKVNSIGSNLSNTKGLKWVITEGDSTNPGNVLADGNFVGTKAKDEFIILPSIEVTASKKEYTVWIWLDSKYATSDMSGESLDTIVWTQVDQVIEDSFEITRLSNNYQIINATVVNATKNIVSYAVTSSNVEPSDWVNITDEEQSRIYTLEYAVNSTGTYYVWFKDEGNKIVSKSINVGNIDTTGPVCTFDDFNPVTIKNGETSSINLTCIDEESGMLDNDITDKINLSSNIINISKIEKENIDNGIKYTITVIGSATGGQVKLILPANTIKNKIELGNEIKESNYLTILNIKDISDLDITLDNTSYVYDGNEKKPNVVIKDGDTTLLLDTDYTLSYSNNINAGEATVTISGIGDYQGTVSKKFNITKATIEVNVTGYKGEYDTFSYGILIDVLNPKNGATIKYGETEGTYNLNTSPEYSEIGEYTVYYQIMADNYETLYGSAIVKITLIEPMIIMQDITVKYTGMRVENTARSDSDGEITYDYYSTSDCSGNPLEEAPVNVGNYSVKASQAASGNYMAASKCAKIDITKGTIVANVTGYDSEYDTFSHGITLNVISPHFESTVKYGTKEGTYDLSDNPMYSDVGEYTVYYQITADNYETVSGSAIVKISAIAPTITLEDKITPYMGEKITMEAVSDSDGEIDYDYYSGSDCTGDRVLLVKSVGEYSVIATQKATNNYLKGTSRCANITVTKAQIEVTKTDYSGPVDGDRHTISVETNLGKDVIYYSTTTPLTSDNYTTGSKIKPKSKVEGTVIVYYYIHDLTGNCYDYSSNEHNNNAKITLYYEDITAPDDIVITADTEYSKTKDIVVTLKDVGGAGLAAGSFKYGFSESKNDEPTSYTEVTTEETIGDNEATFVVSASGFTGKYYLWVIPIEYKDKLDNSNTNTVVSDKLLFDNTAPTGKLLVVKKESAVTTTVVAKDSDSGIKEYGYLIRTGSVSTCPISGYTTSANSIYNFNLPEFGTYYICVKVTDNVGNSTILSDSIEYIPNYLNVAKRGNFIASANSNIGNDSVKTITFMENNEAPANETRTLVGSFDVSEKKNKSIMAYYYETDTAGIYDFYIGSIDGKVYANPDSRYAFDSFKSLTSINNMEYFDTSSVIDMSYMFRYCSSLTTLDVSNFNTSKVTDMTRMFSYCSSLTTLDLSNWDTSNVTNMYDMFDSCSSLTTLDVSNFNTSKVTNMSFMFDRCSSLRTLDVSSFNTSKVTDMSYMFDQCSSLTTLDVSNWDTSNVTNMSDMFWDCNSLTILDVSNFNTSKVTNMNAMFFECDSLTTLDVSNWDTSNVTDMTHMFCGCSGLTTLDVSRFNTSKVTSMFGMFHGCSKLTTLDLNNFDTSNVTNMNSMFLRCSSLTTLNLSSFNTQNVEDMEEMFRYCSKLTELDISNFYTPNLKNVKQLFAHCSKLEAINLGYFNFDKVVLHAYMVYGVPTTVNIYVYTNEAREWLNKNYSSYTNVY